MTRSLYEFTGLSADTPKAEVASAVEARMQSAFSKAAAGDRNAQKELAELRFSYLLWAYGDPANAAGPFLPASERPGRAEVGLRRGGERRRHARRERETGYADGQRHAADRRCSERRNGEYGLPLSRRAAMTSTRTSNKFGREIT